MKKGLKTIIAGSRNVYDYSLLLKVIAACGFGDQIKEVVCGDASGVDKLGERWASDHQLKCTHFPADWSNIDVPNAIVAENAYGKYNKRAGIDRNAKMAEYADALICIIKDDSPGSSNMVDLMKKLGKKVYVWEI